MKATENAALYAVFLLLKKKFDRDEGVAPGAYFDVSGQTVLITLPQGAIVKRDKGEKGDGTVEKTATQNLYGFAVWAAMIKQLKLFKQWNALWRDVIKKAFTEVAVSQNTVGKKIVEKCPEIEEIINELKDLITTQRIESTPRKLLLGDDDQLDIAFVNQEKKAA